MVMIKPGLLEQVRSVVRLRHLSLRTEEAYSDWIKCFILFHRKRHPSEMGADHLQAIPRALSSQVQLSTSTQNSPRRESI